MNVGYPRPKLGVFGFLAGLLTASLGCGLTVSSAPATPTAGKTATLKVTAPTPGPQGSPSAPGIPVALGLCETHINRSRLMPTGSPR